MEVCGLQAAQKPPQRGPPPAGPPPQNQAVQNRRPGVQVVIGPAPVHRFRGHTQVQQNRLRFGTESLRQPGQLPVRRNPLQNRVRDPGGVAMVTGRNRSVPWETWSPVQFVTETFSNTEVKELYVTNTSVRKQTINQISC